jgi:hypothetical protein
MTTEFNSECFTCGLQYEVPLNWIDPENPIVRCPGCNTEWLCEINPVEAWLEPVQEILYRKDGTW